MKIPEPIKLWFSELKLKPSGESNNVKTALSSVTSNCLLLNGVRNLILESVASCSPHPSDGASDVIQQLCEQLFELSHHPTDAVKAVPLEFVPLLIYAYLYLLGE